MLENYLVRRGKYGRFSLRVAIPRALHAVVGRRERIKALGTSDRREAERRALPLLTQWRTGWDLAVRKRETPTETRTGPTNLSSLIVEKIYEPIFGAIENHRRNSFDNEAHTERWKLQERKAALLITDGDLSRWQNVADRLIANSNLPIRIGSDDHKSFVQAVAEAGVDAMRVARERGEGDLFAQPRSSIVIDGQQQAQSKAKPGEYLMDHFERYARQRVSEGVKRKDGIDQDRMVVTQFCEFVGPDRTAGFVTKKEAREYKYALARMPLSYRKKKAYAGLGIHAVLRKADTESAKPISVKTQARYLSALSPFFEWLRNEGLIENNPFDGLHIKATRQRNRRPPFTAKQLNNMLQSPLFTGFLRDGKEHLEGDMHADDWRYWIPLVCIFTGARIGEIAQLRVDNVFHQHGFNFISIREDEDTGQETKSRKSRIVAIHPILEKIGFVKFAEQRKRATQGINNQQLFPELQPSRRQQLGAKPARFWRDYLTAIGIKSGADGFGAHSFRHTIADRFRAAGYLDIEFGPLVLGHSSRSVTADYGIEQQGTAERIFKMIAAVQFGDLNIEALLNSRQTATKFSLHAG